MRTVISLVNGFFVSATAVMAGAPFWAALLCVVFSTALMIAYREAAR